MNVEQLASICHDANASYCRTLEDYSQLPWDSAPKWQRDSAINGVQIHLDNPNMTPEESHKAWLIVKEREGWVHGEIKDVVAKTHPCMLPHDELPHDQQMKDHLFGIIIDLFRNDVILLEVDAEVAKEEQEVGEGNVA